MLCPHPQQIFLLVCTVLLSFTTSRANAQQTARDDDDQAASGAGGTRGWEARLAIRGDDDSDKNGAAANLQHLQHHHDQHHEEEEKKDSDRTLQNNVNDDDDAFTVIFLSDLEVEYRGHSFERCIYVLDYLGTLKNQNLFFDNEFSAVPVDPQLVIHGGDNSHMWGCDFDPFDSGSLCRTVPDELSRLWNTVYQDGKGLPLISNYGNHDYHVRKGTGNGPMWSSSTANRPRIPKTDIINRQSQELSARTYELSEQYFGLSYQQFDAKGEIGQPMFRAEFRGIQLASFGCASNWESYDINKDDGSTTTIYPADEQFQRLSDSLDRDMTTLFFQHYPVRDLNTKRQETIDLMLEFPRAVHLSGHRHVASTRTYSSSDNGNDITDYVAPYPHTWFGRLPGYYALLVSPTRGILQVKQFDIPGLPDGVACRLDVNCGQCHSGAEYWYSQDMYRCGREPDFQVGDRCIPFLSCYRCPDDDYSFWRSKWFFACGSPP